MLARGQTVSLFFNREAIKVRFTALMLEWSHIVVPLAVFYVEVSFNVNPPASGSLNSISRLKLVPGTPDGNNITRTEKNSCFQ